MLFKLLKRKKKYKVWNNERMNYVKNKTFEIPGNLKTATLKKNLISSRQ